jgi:uncharacterized membrane protein YhaH (DUF805 family)
MSFGQSIQTVFTKYAEFRGTASRSEFWWWILFSALVSAALNAVAMPGWMSMWSNGIDDVNRTGSGVAALWSIAVLLPTLAVAVRRLRDAEYAWGHMFWLLLPVAGLIILAVLCAQPPRRTVAVPPVNGLPQQGPSVP